MRTACFVATVLLGVNLGYAQDSKPTTASCLCPKEAKEGFVSLFDAKTLEGWQGALQGYVVEKGLLVCKKHGGGDLYTKKEYADFVFRFEYKLEAGGNNGVGVRTPLEGVPGFVAMEIQLLDDSFPEYQKFIPVQFNGSIYGAVAAKRGKMKPLGQWNAMEIMAKGTQIKVTLNGKAIVDADVSKLPPKRIHDHDLTGLCREKGHLAFCGHGHRVEFRNVRIKEL
ncbi:MAG: DUF1080 domain-containing protein [Planctomycetes bacterium]|nr:DUF1080 domain-containing protein [Planctomycetota bacterium]